MYGPTKSDMQFLVILALIGAVAIASGGVIGLVLLFNGVMSTLQ